jgi:hypothetical protein
MLSVGPRPRALRSHDAYLRATSDGSVLPEEALTPGDGTWRGFTSTIGIEGR